MPWQDCSEQKRIVEIIRGSIANDRIAHAYLFVGPRGSGKKKVALEFAKSLLCLRQRGESCDTCTNCRRISGGNHPDVHVLTPDGTSIKIAQIRQLQKEFSYRAVEGERKIYLVEQADGMTVQAANGLLKFLEEPAAQVIAILMAENVQMILPTIQSRCQVLHFSPPDPQHITNRLVEEGLHEPLVRVASRITGELEEARLLCQSDWFAQLRNLVIQLNQNVLDRGSYALLNLHDGVQQFEQLKGELPLFLQLYLIWLRDLLLWQTGCRQEIANHDRIDDIEKQATRWSGEKLVRGMEEVIIALNRIERNANPQLSLERMIIRLQEG